MSLDKQGSGYPPFKIKGIILKALRFENADFKNFKLDFFKGDIKISKKGDKVLFLTSLVLNVPSSRKATRPARESLAWVTNVGELEPVIKKRLFVFLLQSITPLKFLKSSGIS